jgi:hypothetical protein
VRSELQQQFTDCLCRACLEAAALTGGQGPGAQDQGPIQQ